MNNTAIIVSDAWETALPNDIADYPNLEKEIRVYSEYLNYVLHHERNKGTTIIHDPSNRPIIDAIDTDGDLILQWDEYDNQANEMVISNDFDRYLVCGFHYGRCIYEKTKSLSILEKIGKEVGAIINLSHWFFRDSVQDRAEFWMQHKNYIWTPKEITPVNITLEN